MRTVYNYIVLIVSGNNSLLYDIILLASYGEGMILTLQLKNLKKKQKKNPATMGFLP